ncbi:hypothetical protein Rleg4DRAFT_2314 [Rhizobium leguminosarum bv. trifolii WSM2297]|uniref:Uncharacterized protein n=1 Tax=Rhizobium leguminosarum bv. trifolii WSM2297 TaxID=754762 RepID=J0CBZ8_RHILT|nr:hypothetical protein Rleg4DRAFT_2314 [Rhizobium leguminosarum bv. trifolii WSM2297]
MPSQNTAWTGIAAVAIEYRRIVQSDLALLTSYANLKTVARPGDAVAQLLLLFQRSVCPIVAAWFDFLGTHVALALPESSPSSHRTILRSPYLPFPGARRNRSLCICKKEGGRLAEREGIVAEDGSNRMPLFLACSAGMRQRRCGQSFRAGNGQLSNGFGGHAMTFQSALRAECMRFCRSILSLGRPRSSYHHISP